MEGNLYKLIGLIEIYEQYEKVESKIPEHEIIKIQIPRSSSLLNFYVH